MYSAQYSPLLTSVAGRCLTNLNWQEVGVKTVSVGLTDLIIKPGLAVLQVINSLAEYTGWNKQIILDTRLPVSNSGYEFRSPYDGSRMTITTNQALSLIQSLQPTMVILDNALGAIFDSISSSAEVLQAVDNCYQRVDGEAYYLSDKPANDGFLGYVYTSSGRQSITAVDNVSNFSVLDVACACPTCQQKFTRAYLCHLYQHTPLLCQRLLIQHNVYAALNSRYDVTQCLSPDL